MYYINHEIRILQQSRQIAVFGAGAVAEAVVVCLLSEPYRLSVKFCIVSKAKQNPNKVAGVQVIDVREAEKMLEPDAVIVVAVAEKNLESAMISLQQYSHCKIIPLSYEGDLWSLIRGNYYREYRIAHQKNYLTLEEELAKNETIDAEYNSTNAIRIYTVRSHFDRELQEDISRYGWEVPIQAGAALTERHICKIRDDIGYHISDKNQMYCELTALYWIWKNDDSAYVGMGHYRRHFEINEKMLKQIVCSDIDVVLTIPIFDYPNVESVYRRDHLGDDWNVMIDALRIIRPDYLEDAARLARGTFYYAYNMFIMRRTILEDYCAWLFPILTYCEGHCDEKNDTYQNRYIGFLAEHLMAIYFFHHEDDYKIVHAQKHFILV